MRNWLERAGEAALVALALLIAPTAAGATTAADTVNARAQNAAPDEIIAIGRREGYVRLVVVKDPAMATILSIGTPGVGQLYVGDWGRGLAFLGGIAASVVTVGVAGRSLDLTAEDYDSPARGGNGDEVVQFEEYRRWVDKPRGDFGDLSAGRKVAIIGGLTAAAGLYVWNIVDAHRCAVAHNRRLYSELTGIRLSLGVSPTGAPQGQLRLTF